MRQILDKKNELEKQARMDEAKNTEKKNDVKDKSEKDPPADVVQTVPYARQRMPRPKIPNPVRILSFP